MKKLIIFLVSILALLPACCCKKTEPDCSECDLITSEHLITESENSTPFLPQAEAAAEQDPAIIESGPEIEMPADEKQEIIEDQGPDIYLEEEEPEEIVIEDEEAGEEKELAPATEDAEPEK